MVCDLTASHDTPLNGPEATLDTYESAQWCALLLLLFEFCFCFLCCDEVAALFRVGRFSNVFILRTRPSHPMGKPKQQIFCCFPSSPPGEGNVQALDVEFRVLALAVTASVGFRSLAGLTIS